MEIESSAELVGAKVQFRDNNCSGSFQLSLKFLEQ